MNITVKMFGQLAELAGDDHLSFAEVKDTDELVEQLQQMHPSFITASYTIAVDKKVIHENTCFKPGATVAMLPPFSGG